MLSDLYLKNERQHRECLQSFIIQDFACNIAEGVSIDRDTVKLHPKQSIGQSKLKGCQKTHGEAKTLLEAQESLGELLT